MRQELHAPEVAGGLETVPKPAAECSPAGSGWPMCQATSGDIRSRIWWPSCWSVMIEAASRSSAFPTAGDDGSEERRRLVAACDQFHDVHARDERDAAALINDLQVDIAIDLGGHTENSRPGILRDRPAPVQVSYLGYTGTIGADFIDYIVADRVALPFDLAARISPKRSCTCRTPSWSTTRARRSRRIRRRAPMPGCRIGGLSSAASTTASRYRRRSFPSGCGCLPASREACCGCRR